MGDVRRLGVCRRCRRTFVGQPGELYCAECRREMRRQQVRRRLHLGGAGPWQPLLIFGVCSIGAGMLVGLLLPGYAGDATWVGAIAAIVQVGRRF